MGQILIGFLQKKADLDLFICQIRTLEHQRALVNGPGEVKGQEGELVLSDVCIPE